MRTTATPLHAPDTSGVIDVRVLIIGAGFGGLGAAIRLRQEGVTDFIVIERGQDVGGTWRDNSYPGAACDVPSHLYSFSFAPNPEWSRTFSFQPEIQAYLRQCSAHFGVTPHLRLGEEVQHARWDEAAQRWQMRTSAGHYSAEILIGAMGALSTPSVPELPGLEDFEGTVFHSAAWDHDHHLAQDRVAVIGTGASAIQFVPHLQREAAHVDVYQRTPPWIIPRSDRPITPLERALFRRFPAIQRLLRTLVYLAREAYVVGFAGPRWVMRLPTAVARWHLRRQVSDPALRKTLTPDYTLGCKRVLISNDYYPAVSADNVDIVISSIREIRTRSIVTDDGVERPTDTIVLGTGFKVTDLPAAGLIGGRDGLVLRDAWRDGMAAHLGAAVADFPNLYLLAGPNTGVGHTSMVFMIESQLAYVLAALRHMDERDLGVLEVRGEVQERYNAALQEQMAGTVWTRGGCASWYLDARGRNTTLWPDFTFRFRRETAAFDPRDHRSERRNRRAEVDAGAAQPQAEAS